MYCETDDAECGTIIAGQPAGDRVAQAASTPDAMRLRGSPRTSWLSLTNARAARDFPNMRFTLAGSDVCVRQGPTPGMTNGRRHTVQSEPIVPAGAISPSRYHA